MAAAAKTTDNSLSLPPIERNTSFPTPSNYEHYYPTDSLNTNYNDSIGMNKALPISSSWDDKNLAQQNLHDFLSANNPTIANGSQSTAIAVLAAIAVNAARKWIFRKPKPKSEEKTKQSTNLPKPPSKDKGGRF